jgi:predicted ATPase
MAIVGGITGKPLPRQITEQIVARADGIPLFIEELTRAVIESGRLKQAATAWLLDEPLAPVAIPLTLHDSLIAWAMRKAWRRSARWSVVCSRDR